MKYHLDKLFKSKLQEIKVDYKPEYWVEMEKMLPKQPGGSAFTGGLAGGISSIFFKAAVIISVTALVGITGYFFLNSPENEGLSSQKNIPTQNNIVSKNIINNEKKSDKSDPCNELLSPISENTSDNNMEVAIPDYQFIPAVMPFKADVIAYLNSKESNCISNNFAEPFNVYNYYISNDEEIIIPEKYSSVSSVDNVDGKRPELPKSHEPKNIKPMEKPVKQVFKKRKGLFNRLGIKR